MKIRKIIAAVLAFAMIVSLVPSSALTVSAAEKKTPVLKFSETEVVKKRYNGSFTVELSKKKTDGKITYKSSNTSVAVVDKNTGKVTIKGVGKTRIYAKAAEGKKYKAGKTSYLLQVQATRLKDLSYKFGNSYRGFGYSEDYVIPLSRYQTFFSDTEAYSYYSLDSEVAWSGNCFGMSATSSLLNVRGSGLSRFSFGSGEVALSDLKLSDYNDKLGADLKGIIEALQVAQRHTSVQMALYYNYDDLNGLYKAAVNARSAGEPIIVCMWGPEGGHAVVGYKVEKQTDYLSYLYIYDPNFPLETRYIELWTADSGYVFDWDYWINDEYYWCAYGAGCGISFVDYSVITKLMQERRTRMINTLIVNSDNFVIVDAEGNIAASMKNGELISARGDIFSYNGVDLQSEENIVYLPTNAYSVINREEMEESLKITALNVDQSVTVTTEADTVTIEVDDAADKNTVSVGADKDQNYTIELTSEIPSSDGIDTFTVSGTGSEEGVTAGIEDGVCVVSDSEADLEINGETVDSAEEDDRVEEVKAEEVSAVP